MEPDKTRYEYLKAKINDADKAYYEKDQPFLADSEYDRLKLELEQIEKAHPEWAGPDSPSAKPGGRAVKKSRTQHAVKLLSLQDYFDKASLKAWYDGVSGGHDDDDDDDDNDNTSITVTVEEKIDGLTLALTYVNNKLALGATRGDGSVGEDVTENVKYIQNIPQELPEIPGVDPDNNKIAVRVEVYQPVAAFLKSNEMQLAAGLEPFANPRNCAAGGLRADDPEITKSRGLAAFAFRILYAEGWEAVHARESQHQDLKILKELGFAPVAHDCASDFDAVWYLIDKIGQYRERLPYWTDGAVVKIDCIKRQAELGEGGKYPAWAAAYKYPAEAKKSRVLNIRLQTGRTGVITPVAEIEPVVLSGTTVQNVTLHNQKFITYNKIGIGSVVEVIKSGEIIPKVISVPEPAADDKIFRIEACPMCGTLAIERRDEAGNPTGIFECPNVTGCEAQVLRYLEYFCSRDVMDIRGMGPSVIKALYDAGLVRHVWDIYDLPYKMPEIAALEGFGRKKAENLSKEITKSKNNDIDRLIKSLGIPGVGRHTGKILAKKYPDMQAIMRLGIDTLMSIENIGEITARDIESAWDNGKKDLVEKLAAKGVNVISRSYDLLHPPVKTESLPLDGMTIVATGTIEGFGRADVEDLIVKYGGKASGSVSKKTSCLITGANAGSKLAKAQSLGVPVYSMSEFREKYGI